MTIKIEKNGVLFALRFLLGGKTIEIKIPKEIREYQEAIFFGLNIRQFLCSLLAIAAAVGLYFATQKTMGNELSGWICMLGATPFAACGFVRYHGMTAEQTLWALLRSEVLEPHKLIFQSENLYWDVLGDPQKRKVVRKKKEEYC